MVASIPPLKMFSSKHFCLGTGSCFAFAKAKITPPFQYHLQNMFCSSPQNIQKNRLKAVSVYFVEMVVLTLRLFPRRRSEKSRHRLAT